MWYLDSLEIIAKWGKKGLFVSSSQRWDLVSRCDHLLASYVTAINKTKIVGAIRWTVAGQLQWVETIVVCSAAACSTPQWTVNHDGKARDRCSHNYCLYIGAHFRDPPEWLKKCDSDCPGLVTKLSWQTTTNKTFWNLLALIFAYIVLGSPETITSWTTEFGQIFGKHIVEMF